MRAVLVIIATILFYLSSTNAVLDRQFVDWTNEDDTIKLIKHTVLLNHAFDLYFDEEIHHGIVQVQDHECTPLSSSSNVNSESPFVFRPSVVGKYYFMTEEPCNTAKMLEIDVVQLSEIPIQDDMSKLFVAVGEPIIISENHLVPVDYQCNELLQENYYSVEGSHHYHQNIFLSMKLGIFYFLKSHEECSQKVTVEVFDPSQNHIFLPLDTHLRKTVHIELGESVRIHHHFKNMIFDQVYSSGNIITGTKSIHGPRIVIEGHVLGSFYYKSRDYDILLEIVVNTFTFSIDWLHSRSKDMSTNYVVFGERARFFFDKEVDKAIIQVQDQYCTSISGTSAYTDSSPFIFKPNDLGIYYFATTNSKNCNEVKKIKIIVFRGMGGALKWVETSFKNLRNEYISVGESFEVYFDKIGQVSMIEMQDEYCNPMPGALEIVDSPLIFDAKEAGTFVFASTKEEACSDLNRVAIHVFDRATVKLEWKPWLSKDLTTIYISVGESVSIFFDHGFKRVVQVQDEKCSSPNFGSSIRTTPFTFVGQELGTYFFSSADILFRNGAAHVDCDNEHKAKIVVMNFDVEVDFSKTDIYHPIEIEMNLGESAKISFSQYLHSGIIQANNDQYDYPLDASEIIQSPHAFVPSDHGVYYFMSTNSKIPSEVVKAKIIVKNTQFTVTLSSKSPDNSREYMQVDTMGIIKYDEGDLYYVDQQCNKISIIKDSPFTFIPRNVGIKYFAVIDKYGECLAFLKTIALRPEGTAVKLTPTRRFNDLKIKIGHSLEVYYDLNKFSGVIQVMDLDACTPMFGGVESHDSPLSFDGIVAGTYYFKSIDGSCIDAVKIALTVESY